MCIVYALTQRLAKAEHVKCLRILHSIVGLLNVLSLGVFAPYIGYVYIT